jgi:integrase
VLGPYRHRNRWRVVLVDERGARTDRLYETEAEARAVVADAEAHLEGERSATVEDVVDRYELHLKAKGNRTKSVSDTVYRLRRFFRPALARPWKRLGEADARSLYDALVLEMAVDSHRNMLAEAKSLARWAVKAGLARSSALEGVEGVGRRRRGKPQLRRDEARRLLAVADELASGGDVGAVGVMSALLLGLRAGEVVERVVRDVDDGGRLLWVPSSKTEAGKRTLHVPVPLSGHLSRLAAGRPAQELLFGLHWRDWVRHQARRLCELAGVPVVPAHGLRGTHATLALDAGQSGLEVARSLGHESESTTRGAYALAGAGQRAVAERVVERVQEWGRTGNAWATESASNECGGLGI